MTRTTRNIALALLALAGAACTDNPLAADGDSASRGDLTAAFSAVPVGFAEVTSSFAGDGSSGKLWLPGPRGVAFGANALMGGGLHEAFAGGVGFGRGIGFHGNHGPFGGGLLCPSTFDAGSGRVVCPSVSRNGLTIERSARYTTAAGAVQQLFDSLTTNTVNVQSKVTGTTTFDHNTNRDSTSGRGRGPHHHRGGFVGDTTTILTATTAVDHSSDRTVGGLAQGSTQRTVDATSAGSESTTGTSSRGTFTSTRTAADTTRGVVVPVVDGKPTYPTAGTVIRTMRATVTYAGAAAATTTRREVITYDGSATAKLVITRDGVTQNCTMPLPRGRPTCG